MFKWYDLSLNAMIILYDLGLSGFIKSYDLSFNGMIKLYNQIVYQDHAARFVQYDLVLYCPQNLLLLPSVRKEFRAVKLWDIW